jgi:hypothetical protein
MPCWAVWCVLDVRGAGKASHSRPRQVIFQFFETGYEPVVEGIGWRFAGVGVPFYRILPTLRASDSTYAKGQNVVAFIVAIFLAVVLSHIYYTLQTIKPKSMAASILVHLPFSMWHAWSIVSSVHRAPRVANNNARSC